MKRPTRSKGTPMLFDMILAIACILAVGVAFNYIGTRISK